jgi:23S rRNA (guanosine2251-2'-O)-methyltransferase
VTHLEGKESVLAALLARRRRIELILVKHDTPAARIQDVLDAAEVNGVPVKRVDGKELDAMAHGASHGGVLALALEKPRWNGDDLIDCVRRLNTAPLLLMLEGVDDARNLGFTIRTAEALGCDAILVKKHLWDFDETEVARAASGGYERLPLVQFDDMSVVRELQKLGVKCYGCLANVKRSVFDADLRSPTLLAIGGEKRGLSGAMREQCDGFVTIPTVGGASSLSLSHAGAIVLAEAFRQRSFSPRRHGDTEGKQSPMTPMDTDGHG